MTLVVVLAGVIAVSATTGLGIAGSWFDEQRTILLVALAACALASRAMFPISTGVSSWALLAALALGLLGSILSSRPFVAAVEWSVLCLVVILVLSARSSRHSTIAATAALVASIVPAAYAAGVMANYISALLLGFPVGADTLLVGFSNPRFPAQLQVLTIPLLPIALARAPSAFWRACVAVIAVLWWMCLFGSGSRTGWIAMAIASIVGASFGAESRRWLKGQAAFAMGGLLLWGLLFLVLPTLLSIPTAPEAGRFSNFASVAARWNLWRQGSEEALAQPFLGLGPMHFAYVDNGEGAHPHNFWLQLAAEWGIPAALLAGGAVVGLLAKLWRAVRSEPEEANQFVGIALLAAVAAWFIGTFADGYMVVPTSQAMSTAVLMLAVMWLRLSTPETQVSVVSGRIASYVSTVFLMIALAMLAALPFTEFGRPTQREQAWRSEHPGDTMWPRFWQQGWIGPDADPTAR